jgi:IS605 OrfB family transposase
MSRKQSDFVKTRSGQVASQIVKLAKRYDADIAIEKLRLRSDMFSKKSNRKVNTIPHGQFRDFLISNSHIEYISLHIEDPYHTSKWCSGCGAINDGHHSSNYSLYKCADCGLVVNSDRKASLAVAVKSILERESHSFTDLSSFQISKRRVPVNALLRSDDVGVLGSVSHEHQPMESHLTC